MFTLSPASVLRAQEAFCFFLLCLLPNPKLPRSANKSWGTLQVTQVVYKTIGQGETPYIAEP